MIYDIEEELNKYALAKNNLSKVPANQWKETAVVTNDNGRTYKAGIVNGVSFELQPDEEENPVVADNQSNPSMQFDPEGTGYDLDIAKRLNFKPSNIKDENFGHLQSAAPISELVNAGIITEQDLLKFGIPENSSMLLKGMAHESVDKELNAPHNLEYKKINTPLGERYIGFPKQEGPLPRIVGDTTKATARAAATVGENTTSLVSNILGAPGDLANYIAKTYPQVFQNIAPYITPGGVPMQDDVDVRGTEFAKNPNENFNTFLGGEDINNKIQSVYSWIDTNLMGNNPIDTWIAEPYNYETYGNITEGLMQFVIPAVPAAKLVKAGDMIVNGMVTLSPMVRGMTWGALADMVAFPAQEELLMKNFAEYFAGKTPEERSKFANEIISTFEKNPNHPEIYNQLKNTIDGFVIGGLIEGALGTTPFIKNVLRAAKAVNWKELLDRVEFDPNTLSMGGLGGIRIRGAGDNNPPGPIISNEPFYSVVEETVNNLSMEKGSGQQIFNTIKNSAGVKPEELKWLGLETFLKDKKTVTKQEVLDHINANRLQVEEVDYTYDGPMAYDDIDIRLEPTEDQAFISEEINYIYDNIFEQDISDFPETLKEMLEADLISKADEVYLLDEFNKNGTANIFDFQNTQTKDFVNKFENLVQEKATERYNDFPTYEWRDFDTSYRIMGNEETGFIATDADHKIIPLSDEFNLNSTIDEVKMHMADSGWLDYEGHKPKHTDYQFGEKGVDFENPREFVIHGPDLEGNAFVQGHYPEENAFFHYRTNDRITKDGKRTLFVEEIQSDLHQSARDRGYQNIDKIGDAMYAKEQAEQNLLKLQEKERAWLDKNLLMRTSPSDTIRDNQFSKPVYSFKPSSSLTVPYSDAKMQKLQKEFSKFIEEKENLTIIDREAGDALYAARQGVIDAPLKTSWHETAFRRIVRRAAEEGYDSVTWTPGSMQSARYSGRAPEGMSGFYDKMIKNYAEKWGKKYGAKVSVTNITRSGEPVEVWEFTISPELKETVLEKGVPFYAVPPAAVGAEQLINQETQDNTI